MMGKTLGIITAGQSPDRGLIADIAPLFGPDVDILATGLLDGLADDEIAGLAPSDPERTIAAPLADGRVAAVDAALLAQRVPEKVRFVEERGADLTVVFAGVEVSASAGQKMLIRPIPVVTCIVSALLPDRPLGVIVPLHRQQQQARRRWVEFEGRLTVLPVSAFDGDVNWNEAATALIAADVALAVLDDFAYTPAVAANLSALSGLPVLSSRMLVARIAAQLL